MEKELTIIIPFLNEGGEVENTLCSLFEHTNVPIDIILINDHSDDGFNYASVAEKYGACYIENNKREGVAKSRDIGVMHSRTPFFMLLDAHMRFYNDDWYSILLDGLRHEEKTLFCCQSVVLSNICGEIIKEQTSDALGAVIETNPKSEKFLDAKWNYVNKDAKEKMYEIPCVLGAGYACSRSYWQFLHGLSGLKYYGLDEQLISLKVWLTGGKCVLLNDISLGHIYRYYAPYHIENAFLVYNKLVVSYLLLPDETYNSYVHLIRNKNPKLFDDVMSMWEDNKTELESERNYLREKLVCSFSTFKEKNVVDEVSEVNTFNRDYTFAYIISNLPNSLFFMNGLAGFAFLCLLMAKIEKKVHYEYMAEMALDKVWNGLPKHASLCFTEGISGIGWLVEYICQNNLINGNPNVILAEIDERIQYVNWEKVRDFSFDNGFCGVVAYIYARIIGNRIRKEKKPFDDTFIEGIRNAIRNALRKIEKDCVEYNYFCSFLKYIAGTEVKKLNSIDFLQISEMTKYKNFPLCYCLSNIIKQGF